MFTGGKIWWFTFKLWFYNAQGGPVLIHQEHFPLANVEKEQFGIQRTKVSMWNMWSNSTPNRNFIEHNSSSDLSPAHLSVAHQHAITYKF